MCRSATLTVLVILSWCLPSVAADRYQPAWADIAPLRTIPHAMKAGATAGQAGAELVRAVEGLKPGDRLEIAAGTYSVEPVSYTHLTLPTNREV